MHLILGNALSMLAAVRFGPAAGGIAGSIAGLRTWSLWPQQPFPFSALMSGLEGLSVGYLTRNGRRGPMTAALLFWMLGGVWLSLGCQIFIVGLPLRASLIWQARSVVNGLVAGLAVEVGMIVYEIARKRRDPQTHPSKLRLVSLITILPAAFMALPLLYITTQNVNEVRRQMMSEVEASSSRSVRLVEEEIGSMLAEHRRGVEMAVSLLRSPDHQTKDKELLRHLMASVRGRYPNFRAMFLVDAAGRTLACDPALESDGAGDHSRWEYYSDLRAASPPVYSGIFHAPGNQPTIAIALPVDDERADLKGFVVGWLDLSAFQPLISHYAHKGIELTIADGQGKLIIAGPLQPGQSGESLQGREDFSQVKDQASATVYYTRDGQPAFALDHRQLLTAITMPETGWKILEERSLGQVSASLEEIYFNNLTVLALALFMTLGLSNVGARRMARPINELQQSAAALAAGNWAGPGHSRTITAEFDSLFISFRQMAEKLRSSWDRQQELLNDASIARRELEATFDAMADAVAIIDADDRLLQANRAYCRLEGIPPERLVGRPYTEIVHPQGDWQECEACRARLEGRNALVTLRPEERPINKHLEIRVDQIRNDEGRRIGAVQVIRDLTDMRRAEAEAEKSDALLKNIVDAAYDAVYATDLKGNFLWANRRAIDLFARDSRPLEGELFLRAIHTDDLERVRRNFLAAVNGEAERYEARFLTSDGGVGHALITNSPIYDGDEVVAVLGIARDITDERLAAEQTRRDDKLRALGQLASGVAHNFNNSLTAVLGYTQMVLGKIDDPALCRHLKTVEMAAMDATRMVQRIQSFARQRKDESWGPSELNVIVRDAIDLTRSRWKDDARASGVNYDIIFRPQEGTVVMCDQSAMREVFVNLIINALDAMPAGGRLTISTSVENDIVVVNFADTGVGISEETRHRIFEPFFTTKGAKGNGLGLAVAYGIVERHGGEIQVESEPGKGATFTLKMSIALDSEIVASDMTEEQLARQAFVLVVDDEVPIRALLANVLRARGHKVLLADDGIAGLRALEGSCFDLVITDVSMPGLDGWTLVKEVRRRWPDTKVMVVTGYGDMVETIVPGGDISLADAFVPKPFDIADIDLRINELLLEAGLQRR